MRVSLHYVLRAMALLWLMFSLANPPVVHANESLPWQDASVDVFDQELSFKRFPASGEHLLIWISPGFGEQTREITMAGELAQRGVEVWLIDLAESLFLPRSTSTLRALDGRYVEGLITRAHETGGKKITLMTRAYAALPVLRGARLWQQRFLADTAQLKNPGRNTDRYLTGAILFSPELYSSTPELGLPPVYDPVTSATSIPIMLYQSGKRGNRWQLDSVMQQLESGGAKIMLKILPGVTGVFYDEDISPETHDVLKSLANELPRVIRALETLPMPQQVTTIPEPHPIKTTGLDVSLKPYKGNPQPAVLDLPNLRGEPFRRDSYLGKVTLINFWASWCTPCVEEIPSLNHLREQMQGRAFELISINYAEDRGKIREFMNMVKVDFPVLLDTSGRVAADWNVLVFPATFVIGPDGRIVYGVNGAIYWDSPEVVTQIETLLNTRP